MLAKSGVLSRFKWFALAVVLVLAARLSVQVTQPDFKKLIVAAPKARQILPQLLTPDLFNRQSETATISIAFPVPCGSAPEAEAPTSGPRLLPQPGCAAERQSFTVAGAGLPPNAAIKLSWRLPDGKTLSIERLVTDSRGEFRQQVQARPIVVARNGAPSNLEAEVTLPAGALRPSQALLEVVDAMLVTIFMALLATTIGTLVAAPISFLAAQNITRRGLAGSLAYYATRSLLNLFRSYEPLVMATVFALIVGFGTPFAGVLALAIVTVASLGKMFSEAVESIDPGSIEAVTATGASRFHVVVYAVLPQIVPDFLSFTIYHWDVNVRISTIIGFVGGGGIGYYLSQQINSFEYHKAGTALLAIVVVVWALDFLSAEIRKRIA